MMGMFSYNGHELPDINEVWTDELKETNPYAAISSLGGDTFLLTVLPKSSSYYWPEGSAHLGFGAQRVEPAYRWSYYSNNGVWEKFRSDETYSNPFWVSCYSGTRWVSFDLLDENGDVYLAASTPVNLESKLSISIGQTEILSYNGVELPKLPEWDKEKYPYAYMWSHSSDGSYANLFVFTDKYRIDQRIPNSTYYYCFATRDCQAKIYRFRGGMWTFSDTDYKEYAAGEMITGWGSPFMWVNCDNYYTDGSLALAASEPVPVGNFTHATLTCHNLNVTDYVYKVAAWCYPKGTSYLDAPYAYTSVLFAGVEHSEKWILRELTPGVEYELYACILVDDVATDHNALVTFTTDGVPELDFSSATLTAESVSVEYTNVSIKLAYSGLPYMADGTSVTFQIKGVTDAGDKASVRKISSGSGTVRGYFDDLEPLTDYTATFEIYYNGEPTGVTAEVEFTTGEELPVGGYDRDSFLLGFASGLGATAATKDGAEYNSWTWGYIVGSELRKVL